jgi:predicted outer membrane repeat protein
MTGGRGGHGYVFGAGGGLYCERGCSPQLIDCVFTDNYAEGGGAVCMSEIYDLADEEASDEHSWKPVFVRCIFTNNNGRAVSCGRKWSPEFINCLFENNSAGAISAGQSSTLKFNQCVFRGNSTDRSGGAIGTPTTGAEMQFFNCLFENNYAGYDGGAVSSGRKSKLEFNHCIFRRNSAGRRGGAIYTYIMSEVRIINCLFVANTAYDSGGAIAVADVNDGLGLSWYKLINSTFYGNTSPTFDKPPTNVVIRPDNSREYYSASIISNCIFYNSIVQESSDMSVSFEFGRSEPLIITCIYEKEPDQGGAIPPTLDPLFVDPYGADGILGTEDDDFRLAPDSPAIDSGTNETFFPLPPMDLDGYPRIINAIVDLGAYEFTGVHAKYGGGTGEVDEPYLIYTAKQMNAIGAESNDWDKHFKLMADIDLGGYTEMDFNIIGIDHINAFTGIFDGNGHTISNLSYTSTHRDHTGLFGFAIGAVIKDLGLIDFNVDAGTGDYIGSLAGWFELGSIINCFCESGSISGGREVGGLVGVCYGNSNISDCYFNGSVLGNDSVGGLVAINISGSISNSFSVGEVFGRDDVGGLLGGNRGTINHCYSTADVTGTDRSIGGLVGNNSGTIVNCYSRGDVSGHRAVGGLAGNGGIIINCYSVGKVSGTMGVGGLVGSGSNQGGRGGAPVRDAIWMSFWDIETSGQLTSDGGFGKTTVKMQDPNTFIDAEWDFVGAPDGPGDHWAESDGGGYPILFWQLSTLPELPSFSGGTGQVDEPYLISTADELNSIGDNLQLMASHFRLIGDIDLAGVKFYFIGSQWYPYRGVFDGNGHTISNFSYTSMYRDYTGLFAFATGAQIKDLGLINPDLDIVRGDFHSCLVGYSDGAVITNCYVESGSVSGDDYVGALVGNNNGRITDCYAAADVAGNNRIGGLVGQNDGFRFRPEGGQEIVLSEWGSVESCYAAGNVYGDDKVGGLAGENSGTIINCRSNSSVGAEGDASGGLVGKNDGRVMACYSNSNVDGIDAVGGLVGRNSYGQTTNCYAMGSVTGQWYVGGLVGSNTRTVGRNEGTIENCYSISAVLEGHQIGGLVGGFGGNNVEGEISGCFWDIEMSGRTTSYGGEGKTTAEMQTADTFLEAGWDFVDESVNGIYDIWRITQGQDYPRLWWELSGDGPAGLVEN